MLAPEEEIVPPPQRKNYVIVILLALLITFPTIPYLLYRYGTSSPAQTNKSITIEIRPGMGVSEISESLEDAGLISSPLLFKAYLKLNNLETNLQAGVFSVPPRSSIVDLVEILQYGRNDVTITYIEGWRVEQLASVLAKKLKNIEYSEFVKAARPLEGFLFPDTYNFNIEATQDDVISVLEQTFVEKTADLLSPQRLQKSGLTAEEAITLASIIEREAINQSDRVLIAGILIKRVNEGMRLEADATTQYAVALPKHCLPAECLGDDIQCRVTPQVQDCLSGQNQELLDGIEWWPYNLTKTDLAFESNYNTRLVGGYPPAPISSFGVSALEAVVDFEPSAYYFYLTDANGTTHFATTLEQHNQNTFQYLR